MSNVELIVTGVLVGSASGVCGAVLGAWINGRSELAGLRLNIEAQNERARFADKRGIYAQCLAALHGRQSPVVVRRGRGQGHRKRAR
jgi:hypothetical protein